MFARDELMARLYIEESEYWDSRANDWEDLK